MMKKKEQQTITFYRKIKVSLGLMGILPFLLVVYLFLEKEISLTSTMILCSAVVLFSILMGFILLRQSADQLTALAREIDAVGDGDSSIPLHINADGELKDIAYNFNMLVERLNQANRNIQNQSIQLLDYAKDLSDSYERIKKEEELRNHLCRYLDDDLVEKLMDSQGGLLTRNQRKPVTIMFADIRSFTAIAERMEPEDVVDMLNEYFSIMVDIVFKHDGMLDKFVGDQLMAVFGHISDETKGAHDAVQAALEMQEAAEALMRKRARKELPIFQVGIGINTGRVIIANVGSENRMDYTVIGDTVNAAARLEKQAKGGEVVIGEQTFIHIPTSIRAGKRDKLKVKNRSEPVVCYTIDRKDAASVAEKAQPADCKGDIFFRGSKKTVPGMAGCSACQYMQENFSPVGAQRQSLRLPDSQLRPTIAQKTGLL